MAKIRNKTIYPLKTSPVLSDYFIGSNNSTTSKKTVNFEMEDVAELFYLYIMDRIENPTGTYQPNAVVFGCKVIWSGEGFKYIITQGVIRFNGVLYVKPTSIIILNPSNQNFNRFDTFWISPTSSGANQGTPEENPIQPQINEITQLRLTSVLVKAASTEPDEFIEEPIYLENNEWTSGFSGTGDVIFNETSNPNTGLLHINIQRVFGGFRIIMNKGEDIDFSNFDNISFAIKSRDNLAGSNLFTVTLGFLDANDNQIGVTNVLLVQNTTEWESIAISISSINFPTTTIGSKVFLQFNTPSPNVFENIFIDDWKLQAGITQPPSVIEHDILQGIKGNGTFHLSEEERDKVNSALQSGDNILELVNDAGYITAADIPTYDVLRVVTILGSYIPTNNFEIIIAGTSRLLFVNPDLDINLNNCRFSILENEETFDLNNKTTIAGFEGYEIPSSAIDGLESDNDYKFVFWRRNINYSDLINIPDSNLPVSSVLVGHEDFTISQSIKIVQRADLVAAAVVNQLPLFTVPSGVLFIVKIFFSVQTTEIINGVEQLPLGRIMVQQTILNTGAREYGVGTPPVTANDFSILTSTFESPQTLIDLSSQINDEAGLIAADLEAIRNVFNNAPNCVIRSSAVVTATVGDTTKNWLFTGGEGKWGADAKQALRDDMFFEIVSTDSVFKPQHNEFRIDKNYNIGTPTTPATGVLTLDLAGAKVGVTILMYYSGASLPAFVSVWLDGTNASFVANETCLISFNVQFVDGVNTVITGVVNKI